VIGGGDWAEDRLVPDAMRAFLGGRALEIRNPQSLRPWQHVLDPVLAYLTLAEHPVEDGGTFAEAWNFGPAPGSEITVKQIADLLVRGDTARDLARAGARTVWMGAALGPPERSSSVRGEAEPRGRSKAIGV